MCNTCSHTSRSAWSSCAPRYTGSSHRPGWRSAPCVADTFDDLSRAAWLLGFALLHLLAELHELGTSGAEFRVGGRFCPTYLSSPLALPVSPLQVEIITLLRLLALPCLFPLALLPPRPYLLVDRLPLSRGHGLPRRHLRAQLLHGLAHAPGLVSLARTPVPPVGQSASLTTRSPAPRGGPEAGHKHSDRPSHSPPVRVYAALRG